MVVSRVPKVATQFELRPDLSTLTAAAQRGASSLGQKSLPETLAGKSTFALMGRGGQRSVDVPWLRGRVLSAQFANAPTRDVTQSRNVYGLVGTEEAYAWIYPSLRNKTSGRIGLWTVDVAEHLDVQGMLAEHVALSIYTDQFLDGKPSNFVSLVRNKHWTQDVTNILIRNGTAERRLTLEELWSSYYRRVLQLPTFSSDFRKAGARLFESMQPVHISNGVVASKIFGPRYRIWREITRGRQIRQPTTRDWLVRQGALLYGVGACFPFSGSAAGYIADFNIFLRPAGKRQEDQRALQTQFERIVAQIDGRYGALTTDHRSAVIRHVIVALAGAHSGSAQLYADGDIDRIIAASGTQHVVTSPFVGIAQKFYEDLGILGSDVDDYAAAVAKFHGRDHTDSDVVALFHEALIEDD